MRGVVRGLRGMTRMERGKSERGASLARVRGVQLQRKSTSSKYSNDTGSSSTLTARPGGDFIIVFYGKHHTCSRIQRQSDTAKHCQTEYDVQATDRNTERGLD